MILKVPNRTPQKVKLRNTVSTLGTSFRDRFADLFGKMLTKRESQNEARIQAARAPFDMILRCDVFARKRSSDWNWSHITLRAACFAGHSLVIKHNLEIPEFESQAGDNQLHHF